MKTPLPILLCSLFLTSFLHAEMLAWWRLDADAPPLTAAEGGPDLKWWSEGANPYTTSESAPPAALYQVGQSPAARSFASAESYGGSPGGLLTNGPCDFSGREGGLTIEGFFSTLQIKDKHENQTIIACGDGGMDFSWTVRLLDGRPTFAVFREGDSNPLAQVEIDEDVRTGEWYYFAARILPSASGSPSKISLAVSAMDGRTWTRDLALPEGSVIRSHAKPLLIGRSSLYIDAKPDYKGTWDTFQGAISDLRISSEALQDSGLLGRVKK